MASEPTSPPQRHSGRQRIGTSAYRRPPAGGPEAMIVEDDIKFAQLVSWALQRQGFVTQIVGTGDAALRAMRERWPALAVLDVMIPHPDGIEVCRQFRRDGFDRPIVALSARSAPHDRQRALDAGADVFLAKPVPLADLGAMVLALHEERLDDADSVTARPGDRL